MGREPPRLRPRAHRSGGPGVRPAEAPADARQLRVAEKPERRFPGSIRCHRPPRRPAFTPDLAQMVADKENRAVAHAAFLTLDRLVLHDAAAVLSQLEQKPELMAGREQTRANYFARADVRDPRQHSLL